ncbi:MAG: response regulator [Bacteriovoracaceae bacterium]|nr:response regulator [Bacteriovoracaceae bacterium]
MNDEQTDNKYRIMVVDDETILTRLYEIMLKKLGYIPVIYTDSLVALEAFREDPDKYDLIITDLTMPNMTGVELGQEISKIRSDIPIILVTGHSETATPQEIFKARIRNFIQKPFTKEMMHKAIEEELSRKNEE